jgi:hypothetical protein
VRNRRERRTNSVIAFRVARCGQLLIDLLLFGGDAHHGAEQIVASSLAIGGRRKTEPLALKQRAGEQPALIGAGAASAITRSSSRP